MFGIGKLLKATFSDNEWLEEIFEIFPLRSGLFVHRVGHIFFYIFSSSFLYCEMKTLLLSNRDSSANELLKSVSSCFLTLHSTSCFNHLSSPIRDE